MNKFQYKEIDPEGWETLDVISGAKKFNEWMYQTIRPFCAGNILEVGSGIGNISEFFINARQKVTLSDIRENYCKVLKAMVGEDHRVIQLDLTHPDFDAEYGEYINQFDTVFALNVVEHIQDDDTAIRNCHKLLKARGKLIILVPAYQQLYNRFDKELEHFRRYNADGLEQLFIRNDFHVIHSQYFNFMGIPGWYVSGKLQKNKTIPKSQMVLYDKLVPLFKLIDRILLNKVGLSVITVGVKK